MTNVPNALRPQYFFDLSQMDFPELFKDVTYVWEVVKRLQDTSNVEALVRAKAGTVGGGGKTDAEILGGVPVKIASSARVHRSVVISGSEKGLVAIDDEAEIGPGTVISAGGNAVCIAKGAKIGPHAHIDAAKGAVYVGEKATLRQGAYLRELSLVLAKAVIGNSCEVKCALIGKEAEVPHFNYVGDSVFGYKSHTGAGVKISNLKITPDPKKADTVKVKYEGQTFDTGMRKFGVILGDRAQLGCNSVANPGTFVGKNVLVYTGSNIVGFIAENTIVKLRQNFEHAALRSS